MKILPDRIFNLKKFLVNQNPVANFSFEIKATF